MPRRNHRAEYEPLDLTPAEIVTRKPILGPPGMNRPPTWRERDREERERRERQSNARINGGIDWSMCLVPGCGRELRVWGRPLHMRPEWRNHTLALPLCVDHLAVAANQAAREKDDPLLATTLGFVTERRQQKAETLEEAAKKAWLAKQDGQMYYLRLNGLIKVGWTRELDKRLKAYGPDVEVLCHYPATRQDETNLHRQLRPFLAKGREWYQDCQAIADFVEQVIAQHGRPTASAYWTTPPEAPVGRRQSARSKPTGLSIA